MYNFLDSRLNPNVETKTPATDGYEVDNLISDNPQLISKGFLAYSPIRPPIDIDFEFICSVRLHYITIWPSVGSQKSSGFDILAKNSNSEYATIAKAHIDEPGLVICNRKFYSEDNKPKNVPENFAVRFFKSCEFKIFTCAEKVRIKILRTASSVPCIGKIEIWGDVSRTCSDKTKETIKYLMSSVRKNAETKLNEPSCSKINNKLEGNFDIPEEFIDPISCEVMSIPMTLPCGKTIDQSTLEKHQKSESKWGRNASDPFTGQLFTLLRKPILNSALKSRIDEFLLKNANVKETQKIQRTVGRKPQINNKRTHSDLYQEQPQVNNKRPKTEEIVKQRPSTFTSLDEAIQNTFKNYNIIRFTADETSEPIDSCGKCKKENNLYVLLCKHFLCRQCLVSVNLEYKCKVCSKPFLRSEVKKYHK